MERARFSGENIRPDDPLFRTCRRIGPPPPFFVGGSEASPSATHPSPSPAFIFSGPRPNKAVFCGPPPGQNSASGGGVSCFFSGPGRSGDRVPPPTPAQGRRLALHCKYILKHPILVSATGSVEMDPWGPRSKKNGFADPLPAPDFCARPAFGSTARCARSSQMANRPPRC